MENKARLDELNRVIREIDLLNVPLSTHPEKYPRGSEQYKWAVIRRQTALRVNELREALQE